MSVAAAVMGAGALTSAIGARQQAQAQQQSLNYQSAVASNNAQISADQASLAMTNGQTATQAQDLKAGQIFGAQRAQLAASGVDLGQGSANDILTTTQFMANRDHATSIDNAMRQAWGYNVQAADQRANAAALTSMSSSINPNFNALTSLLGSAGGAARMWYGGQGASGGNPSTSFGTTIGNSLTAG